jgi:hypothetical protein
LDRGEIKGILHGNREPIKKINEGCHLLVSPLSTHFFHRTDLTVANLAEKILSTKFFLKKIPSRPFFLGRPNRITKEFIFCIFIIIGF